MDIGFELCDCCIHQTNNCCIKCCDSDCCESCIDITKQLAEKIVICVSFALFFPPYCVCMCIGNNCCGHNLTDYPYAWKYNDLMFYWCFKRNMVNLLDLGHEELTFMPKNTFNLTNLKELCCGNNKLDVIPPEIKLLKNLNYVSFRYNEINIIPIELFELEKLERLDLDRNHILEIPKQIGNLIRLTYLSIQHNHIAVIPDEIGNLKSLITFNIESNRITTIPYSIMNLKNLNTLEFRFNDVSVFPKHVFFKRINVRCGGYFPNGAEITVLQNNNHNNLFLPFYDERLEIDFGLSLA